MVNARARLGVGLALLVIFGVLAGAAAAASPDVVISEFRVRGPNGAADEFVELYNRSAAPVAIGGWKVNGSNSSGTTSTRATIPAGTTIGIGCHYLVANSSTSGGPYSGAAAADTTYTIGITDDGGIALLRADNSVADQVGMSAGSAYGEGTRLASLGSSNLNRSYERKPGGAGGSGQDTDDNASDFALISPSDPQNSASPCVAGTTPTNPSGIGAADPATVAAGGTSLLTVQVTAGTNPASTGIAVTGDLTSIGGSAAQSFHDDGTNGDATAGDGTWSYLATVAANAALGSKSLPVTITDDQGRSGSTTIALGVISGCGTSYTHIPAIQGSGDATPLQGQFVATEGVVVGDYEGPSPALRGFYLQDPAGDGDPATSDGIFVFNGNADDVSLGDRVRVAGTVSEFQGQTQLSSSGVAHCGTGTVAPVDVTLPAASANAFERYEGMLVRMPQTLYVTEHFQLGRFGQVVMSSGDRLWQPTALVAPGAAAATLQAENDLNRIIVDDAVQVQNPDPIVFGRGGDPLSATNTLRGGDTATGMVGVMTYTWAGNSASGNAYRLRPVGALDGGVPMFQPTNPRPADPPAVGGSVRVAGMNLLNFFNTFDGASSSAPWACTGGVGGEAMDCRGADDAGEFARQWPKTVAAVVGTGADVIGVVEVENDGYGPDSAIAFLVSKLNEATAPGTYAYVDVDARTGQVNALGTDAIKVGVLYKPGKVTPVGATAALNSVAFVNGGDADPRNRPALAQAFRETATGETFVVSVNHLKSKGSACDAPDSGDGQANCAQVRTNAANLLADWLASDPTGTGAPARTLIVGDLNSYAEEDPIRALESHGLVNLVAQEIGQHAYSYVFDGQWGYLDYAIGAPGIVPDVSGVGEWHIDADEPSVLDYNDDFKSAGQIVSLYAPDRYRISDHDPVLVGLDLRPTVAGMCALVGQYLPNDGGLANSFCVKLKSGAYGAFVNEVQAQTGKALTAAQAATLLARVALLQ